MSILFQSFSGNAESIDEHQVNLEHLQTAHSHVNENIQQNTNADGHNIQDCHHCGHCSGAHNMAWVFVKISYQITNLNIFERSPYLVKTPSEFIDTTLRPPIS
jgi:hypothetical protein